MSRIGKRILELPSDVTLTTNDNIVTVNGPKGELSTEIHKDITVIVKDNKVTVERKNDNVKAFHGTANANIKNLIEGVTKGFEKRLEAVGVGYRFDIKGNTLVVKAGYSHPVEKEIPAELKVEAVTNTELLVSGIDKILVGEFAANVRKIRKPEPYKGKGIRYKGEEIRRKEGKSAK